MITGFLFPCSLNLTEALTVSFTCQSSTDQVILDFLKVNLKNSTSFASFFLLEKNIFLLKNFLGQYPTVGLVLDV